MAAPRHAVRNPLLAAVSRARRTGLTGASTVGFAALLLLAFGPAGGNAARVTGAPAAAALSDPVAAVRTDQLGQGADRPISAVGPGRTASAVARPAGGKPGSSARATVVADLGPAGVMGELGIPAMVLQAYHRAADAVAASDPACRLPWWLLAGIGHTESGHAESGRLTPDGTTRGRILGPVLNGGIAGDAVIRDTDGGRYDGDTAYDRAVGPMQFIPSTWATWGVDGNGDGLADPNNIFDATLAAGHYLCADGRDLSTAAGLQAAVLSYNHSKAYLDTVLAWGTAYRDGTVATPGQPGPVVVDVVSVRPPLQARPPKRPQAVTTAKSGVAAASSPTSAASSPAAGSPAGSGPSGTTTNGTGSGGHQGPSPTESGPNDPSSHPAGSSCAPLPSESLTASVNVAGASGAGSTAVPQVTATTAGTEVLSQALSTGAGAADGTPATPGESAGSTSRTVVSCLP